MKLIKPKVEILDKIDGQAILERIEQIARTCYKSEPKYGYEYKLDNEVTVTVEEPTAEEDKIIDALLQAKDHNPPTGKRISTTAAKLVKRLIESKHEAMLEFVDITVKFTTDRGVSHELVRHKYNCVA